MFKRRTPRTFLGWMRELIYPNGGFVRATRYVLHRMRRLPDEPHRVARGVFAGCLIGFLPLPGVQFLFAAALAWLMRGNIFAALLGTFNSNPVTTPFFAVAAISLGHWMLGIDTPLNAEAIGAAFADAGENLWGNFMALFSERIMEWQGLTTFWHTIYVPYFIGALAPGVFISLAFYYVTIPLVRAYQKARLAKAAERGERRIRLRAALTEAAARLKPKAEGRKDGSTEPED